MGQPNPVAVLDKAVAILRAVADEPPASPSSSRAPVCPAPPRTGSPSRSRDTAWSSALRTARGPPDRRWRSSAAAARAWPRSPAATSSPCATAAARAPVLRPRGRHPRLRRRGRAHQRPARHGAGRRAAADDRRVRRARSAGVRTGRRGDPPAAQRQLHRPHAARRPPARVGTQHRGAGARRRLLSAPVRSPAGTVLGAVSISGPVERLGRRPSPELVNAVLDAATAISRAAR